MPANFAPFPRYKSGNPECVVLTAQSSVAASGITSFHTFGILNKPVVQLIRPALERSQRVVSVALSSCRFRNRPRELSLPRHQPRCDTGIGTCVPSPAFCCLDFPPSSAPHFVRSYGGRAPHHTAGKGPAPTKLFAEQRAKGGENPGFNVQLIV